MMMTAQKKVPFLKKSQLHSLVIVVQKKNLRLKDTMKSRAKTLMLCASTFNFSGVI